MASMWTFLKILNNGLATGTFILTTALIPVLKKSQDPRVVSVFQNFNSQINKCKLISILEV